LTTVYENQYQSRLETFRQYLEKEKKGVNTIEEDSMQVDVADRDNDDEDELESTDELVNTNPTSPL
jgi:hypothetical protein